MVPDALEQITCGLVILDGARDERRVEVERARTMWKSS